MNQNVKRVIPLVVVLTCGAAAAMAWPAHPAEPSRPGTPVLAGARTPPEPAEPPEPPEPPDEFMSDMDGGGDGVFMVGTRSGWLGVQIDDVTEANASGLKLRDAHGALVTHVEESSPAGKAGLHENDVIVSYQGQRVEGTASLRRFVRETPNGRAIAIGVSRDGSEMTMNVKVEPRPARRWSVGSLPRLPRMKWKDFGGMQFIHGGPRLGVGVSELSSQLGDYFGVKSGEGVLVTEIFEGTPAEKAGMKAGDVIMRIDGDKISDSGDIHDAIREKAGKEVEVVVLRDHRETTLRVTLDREAEGEMRSALPRRIRREAIDEALRARLEARDAYEAADEAARDSDRDMRQTLRDVLRLKRDAERDRVRVVHATGDLMSI